MTVLATDPVAALRHRYGHGLLRERSEPVEHRGENRIEVGERNPLMGEVFVPAEPPLVIVVVELDEVPVAEILGEIPDGVAGDTRTRPPEVVTNVERFERLPLREHDHLVAVQFLVLGKRLVLVIDHEVTATRVTRLADRCQRALCVWASVRQDERGKVVG